MDSNFVLGFLFSPDKKEVVLASRAKGRGEDTEIAWGGIGGVVEYGETPEVAMARQAEESGIGRLDDWRLFAKMQGMGRTWYCFKIESELYKDVKKVAAEEVSVWPVNNLPEATEGDIRWLIPMALDNSLAGEQLIWCNK